MPSGPIQWTRSAQSDLRAIHDYIARDSPYFARQTVDNIRCAAERLSESFPAGAIVLEWDEPNLREVYAGTYRVIGRRGDGEIGRASCRERV